MVLPCFYKFRPNSVRFYQYRNASIRPLSTFSTIMPTMNHASHFSTAGRFCSCVRAERAEPPREVPAEDLALRLVGELRQQAVPLVDGFGIPDECLAAPIAFPGYIDNPALTS